MIRLGPPTIRMRVAAWTMACVLASGVWIVLLINLGAPEVLRPEVVPVAVEAEPGQGTPTPRMVTGAFYSAGVLQRLRTLSLYSLLGAAVLGAGGAYVMAGLALTPLRRLAKVVQEIDSRHLDRRLPEEGPDDELQDLTRAFNHLLDRLEKAFAQQSRFVTDVAHELRTPLATMKAELDLLAEEGGAVSAQEWAGRVQVLRRMLERLERLVADLLLLARGERDLQRCEVALWPLLEEVITDLEPLAARKGIGVTLEGDPEVTAWGDETLLARALANLIDNAIRYNRPGGRVWVKVGRDGQGAWVAVSDNGPGIPPEDVPYVFQRAYRGRTATEGAAGVGLGLEIARHVVQLHGGSIELSSTPGQGTTFTVRLPRTPG